MDERDRKLWEQVLAFNIEEYQFNYGFALRLATENGWSFHFTATAITEYKKFMFLAAISEEMIAPAEIIDTVWHLHLIYTDSYASFCSVLGKDIKHIPSRKEVAERGRFETARVWTQKLYENNFGPMPDTIWQYDSMYASLPLRPSLFSREQSTVVALCLLPIFVAGLYFLLQPVYRQVSSVYFIPVYCILGIVLFLLLQNYNRKRFAHLLKGLDKAHFLLQLDSLEVITLKTGRVQESVHAVTNELLVQGYVGINEQQEFSAIKGAEPTQLAQVKVYDMIAKSDYPLTYLELLQRAVRAPYFQAIQAFCDTLLQYIKSSKYCSGIVRVNYFLMGFFLALGLVRVLTGLSAGKPVLYISFVLIFFLILAVTFLKGIVLQLTRHVLPRHYLHSGGLQQEEQSGEWTYLQSGKLALAAAFVPLVAPLNARSGDSSSACGTSCGSSCGGSGCGGCGD